MNEMATPDHPIEVGSNNICELVRSNKLQSLKLIDLRAISENLGLETNGSFSRKKKKKKKLSESRLKSVQNLLVSKEKITFL